MGRGMKGNLFAGLMALALAGLLWPAVTPAGEVLNFKPVPRESVSRFEKIKIVKHTPAPDPTDTIGFGDTAPESPEPPDPPATPVDRSGGVMKIGTDIHVAADEVVHGDLSSVNGDITIEGHVEGDVVAMHGNVDLKSTARVDGDVVCLGGDLTEEPGAQVSGQKVTAGRAGGWSIRDRSNPIDTGDREDGDSSGSRRQGDRVAGALVWLLVLTLFGWLFVRVAPGRTVAAIETFNRSPGLSLGIGSMIWALIIPSLIALVLVVALLCITIIGIPLALAALVGYALFLAVLMLWGFTVAGTLLGGGLSKATQDGTLSGAPPSTHPAGVAGAAVGVGAGATLTPHGVSLMRRMLTGVGVLMGSIVMGQLLRASGLGPLHGMGTLMLVLGIIASAIATTIGAGALLRSEFAMGTFHVIWNGRRFGKPRAAAAAAPAQAPSSDLPGSATAPWPPQSAPPAPAPAPPSPPDAFRPPADPEAGGGMGTPAAPQDTPPPIS